MGLSLPWHEPVLAKAVRTVYQRNAVIFQYNRLEAERPLTQTSLSSCEPSVLSLSGGPTLVGRRLLSSSSGTKEIETFILSVSHVCPQRRGPGWVLAFFTVSSKHETGTGERALSAQRAGVLGRRISRANKPKGLFCRARHTVSSTPYDTVPWRTH